jgi:polysaccharide biosynthesis protein PelA
LRFSSTLPTPDFRLTLAERSFISIGLSSLLHFWHSNGQVKGLVIVLSILAGLLLFLPAADAEPSRVSGTQVVKREVLALYDSREESRADQTRIHRMVEMPLNHLGYVVTYWDLELGPPGPELTSRLHGVVTWLRRSQASKYYVWAQDLVTRGVRFAVLGGEEVFDDDIQWGDVNRLFKQIGFQVDDSPVDLTYGTRVLHRDGLIGFEQQLDPVLPAFPIISAFGPDVSSHLVLEQRDSDIPRASSLVLTSPRGGFAAEGYLVYIEPATNQTKWIVDPFAFFQQAFGNSATPIPDVTTVSGRRIYFSHIDGDGWNNVSQIEPYKDMRRISAQVVLDKLIAPYADLPVSVGVIGANVDERYGPVEASRRIASELFALPQVEVATHTYTHPYEWSFFENYNRQAEERAIEAIGGDVATSLGDRLVRFARRLFLAEGVKPRVTTKVELPFRTADNVKAAADDPPRAFSEFPFDLDQETRGAVQAADRLAPSGKRTALYLWSGGAEPFEAVIARTRRLGVRNMNGGDSRVDPDFPSITYLAPVGRAVGAERQIYATNANDYVYMSDGAGREHGYLYLDATLRATEMPRRLKPINLYYHMYAGERAAQLAAVRTHLENARQSALAPIAASKYAAIAEGFYTTEIVATGSLSWLIRNRGALESVRVDDAKGLSVDFERSVGVIGHRHKDSSLYIALDGGEAQIMLALTVTPQLQQPTSVPHLIESRWVFRDMRRRECGFDATAQGFGAGQMRWAGLTPGAYHVRAHRAGKLVWESFAKVDVSGGLDITVDADAVAPVTIYVSCTP